MYTLHERKRIKPIMYSTFVVISKLSEVPEIINQYLEPFQKNK